jgi:hypothetical protein
MSDADGGLVIGGFIVVAGLLVIGACLGGMFIDQTVTPAQFWTCDDGCGERGLKEVSADTYTVTCRCKDGFEKSIRWQDIKETK